MDHPDRLRRLRDPTTLIAPDWYLAVHPAWAFGEIPAAAVMVVLVRRWVRADQREQARLDRAADRAEATGEADDRARYNAFLAAAKHADSDGPTDR
ncbi:hypothetical protein ACIBXA_18855 [Micromonospora echinaurantiaca]|uniref:hypothetical protein n=1 Tax=Micromonospora echinaurantiaca TaxID=47857 RepID=UPI0037B80F6D